MNKNLSKYWWHIKRISKSSGVSISKVRGAWKKNKGVRGEYSKTEFDTFIRETIENLFGVLFKSVYGDGSSKVQVEILNAGYGTVKETQEKIESEIIELFGATLGAILIYEGEFGEVKKKVKTQEGRYRHEYATGAWGHWKDFYQALRNKRRENTVKQKRLE